SQASVPADASFIPLAARFVETRHSPDAPASKRDWFFTRSEMWIETAGKDDTEIWERDERREISLKRIFHGDRKLIEYTSGELRAQRRIKAWSVLATILDERILARLEKRGETTVLKQPAVKYVGRLGDERVEVVWLARQAIPAKLVRKNGETSYTLELQELRETPDASWPTVKREIDAYEWLDGADLGDREYDPFVRKVLSLDAGRPAGHTH
ncbi:MAG: hypothetical protein WBK96_13840, partial [Candidatus Manganitrophaceae bacterium]